MKPARLRAGEFENDLGRWRIEFIDPPAVEMPRQVARENSTWCRDCLGRGFLRRLDYRGDTRIWTCATCDGTGSVTKASA